MEEILASTSTTTSSSTTTTTTTPTTTTSTTTTTTIAPYKVYTALLTQTGTNAPVADVKINTLGGTVTWTRSTTGEYLGTLSGGATFTSSKTFILLNHSALDFDAASVVKARTNGAIQIHLATYSNSSGTPADGIIASSAVLNIEIRVYP